MTVQSVLSRAVRPVVGTLALVALIFGARKIGLAGHDLAAAVDEIGIARGAVLLILACAGMWGFSVISAVVLSRYEDEVDLSHALAVTLSSQLGKYLPTGVGAVVARAEVYRNGAGGRKRSYTYVLFTTAGQLAGGVALALAAVAVWRPSVDPLITWAAAALGLANLAFGTYLGVRLDHWHPDAVGIGPRVWMRRTLLVSAAHVAPWAAAAAVPVLCLNWLGVGVGTGLGTYAAILSWIAGMLVFVLPAGVGVREVMFTQLLVGVPASQAALVAVISRALYTVADLAGGSAALLWLRKRG